MLILYFVACGFTFGMYRLDRAISLATPLGELNGNDLVLVVLLLWSLPEYLRLRKEHPSPWFRWVELAWVALLIMLGIAALNSVAENMKDRFVHLRFLEPYLLFFPTVAVLTDRRRLRQCMTFGICLAVLGTILTIAQAIHGLTLLTDSPVYNVGSWLGSRGMVGALVRVNLPISNWAAFVILLLVASLLIRWRWWVVGLFILLALTVFINFARSLWLSLFVATVLEIVLFSWNGILDFKSGLRIALVPAVGAIALLVAPLVGLESLGDSMIGRIAEGVQFLNGGSGTWGERVDQSAWTWALLDQGYWLFGVGTDYQTFSGYIIDLGLPSTLLSVGIVGMTVLFGTLTVCFFAGIDSLKEAVRRDDLAAIVVCVGLPAVIIQRLVYQHWLYPESAGILAAALGAALMVPYLPGEPEEGEDHEFEEKEAGEDQVEENVDEEGRPD